MARLFDDASSEYLIASSAVVTAAPFTMACWFNTNDATINQNLIGISSEDDNDYHGYWLNALGALSDQLDFACYAGAGVKHVYATSSFSANTWHHACGVASASNSRKTYLDGGNSGTGADECVPLSLDNTTIGAVYYWTGGANEVASPMSGSIAEAAIWDVALTDAEVAILAKGYSPLLVRPESLVFYAPLIRDTDDDIVGGLQLTAVNTPSISAHPRVIYPGKVQIGVAAGEAPPPTPAVNVSDSSSATDTPTLTLPDALAGSGSDSASVADTPTAYVETALSVSDSAELADTPTVEPLVLYAQCNDSSTVTDTPALEPLALALSVEDSTTGTDTPAVTVPDALALSVEDTVTGEDTPTAALEDLIASISDSPEVTDTPVVVIPDALNASVQDEATVTDGPTVTLPEIGAFEVSVSDGNTVTDTPVIEALALVLAVEDTSSVADTPTCSMEEAAVDLNVEIMVSNLFAWVQGVKVVG